MRKRTVAVIAATATVVAGALVATALLTDVRRTAYATLAALVLAGLWPIVLLVCGIAALMVLGLLAGLAGGADGAGDGHASVGDTGAPEASGGAITGGARLTRWYFRRLGRIRQPIVWGILVGGIAGSSLVWGILAFYVLPRERETLRMLLDLQSQLEHRYDEDGRYPPESPDGRARAPQFSAGSPAASPAGDSQLPLRDAFGHPIAYRVTGAWKAATYSLLSLGADGRPSSDDICVMGGTRLGKWLQRAAAPARLLWDAVVDGKNIGLRDSFVALQAARCGAQP